MNFNIRSNHRRDYIAETENIINVPNGFLIGLLEESDWSFVIKISALMEAACTHALASVFHQPELVTTLSFLDQGSRKCGRVTLLLAMNIIDAREAETLYFLGRLRNELAHDVSNVNFGFPEHFIKIKKSQRKEFVRRFADGYRLAPNGMSSTDKKACEEVIEHPKIYILFAICEIVQNIREASATEESRMAEGKGPLKPQEREIRQCKPL